MVSPRIKDRHWMRQAFLLPPDMIDNIDKERRMYSRGRTKFSDTTLGGNQAINPIPQSTRFCDIEEERIFSHISYPMGRCYSEIHDDNQVILNIRCGHPTHTALSDFFGVFYNSQAAYMARTGRAQGLFFNLGLLGGTILTLPFKPFMLLGDMWNFMVGKQRTKFYYLKPSMPVYWNALNGLVNAYAAERGMQDGSEVDPTAEAATAKRDAGAADYLNLMFPSVYSGVKGEDGQLYQGIDIYAVANRYQVLANAQYEKAKNWRDSYQGDFGSKEAAASYNAAMGGPIDLRNRSAALSDILKRWANNIGGKVDTNTTQTLTDKDGKSLEQNYTLYDVVAENSSGVMGSSGTTKIGEVNAPTGDPYAGSTTSFFDLLKAEMRDGSQFISFRVDDPGDGSESFSNSTRESDLASTINSMSNSSRAFKFNFANGNMSDNMVVEMLEGAVGAVTSFISGVASSVGISGLAALAGNANIDIPKYWDSSTASLPRQNYSFDLKAPYQSELVRMQTLMVPLFALLAAALPLSTGGSSYTSPFLVEAYCQGRAQTRTGIIDSLSITRSEFTRDGRPLSINVQFSIIDMSSIMHMPLTMNFNPVSTVLVEGLAGWLTTDDSAFSDYMAVLASSSLANQVYPWRKLKRNYSKTVANLDSWFSATHAMNWIGGWDISRAISGFWNATDRG